ncbi:DUF3515 domain-containing protein [Streptomyces sp. LP05-1]|uniref:DUF3515 domain-containing protein n=1 Tax=Streptomyces pyxinae TaxID=2970734 RepID=A0ABT2CC62_9ACTN|nr:DUF3515 domain-containing protein [Streptomyces sp. LP05-1]MCS0635004.1 DUF3515 domain-containing protein [Streptomyces sp. LP05-1]
MTKHVHRPLRAVVALTACSAFLAGCGSSEGYNLTKPPFGGNPACGTLTGKVPDELGGHRKEESGVAGAVAWGEEGDIILYCGMPEPKAGDDCRTEGGVDWAAQKPADDRTAKMFATQGRNPAVQVRFRSKDADASAVLSALAPAVKDIKATSKGCGAGN